MQTKKSQSERFTEKARELECDEDEGAFDEKLKQLAKTKATSAPSGKTKKSDKE